MSCCRLNLLLVNPVRLSPCCQPPAKVIVRRAEIAFLRNKQKALHVDTVLVSDTVCSECGRACTTLEMTLRGFPLSFQYHFLAELGALMWQCAVCGESKKTNSFSFTLGLQSWQPALAPFLGEGILKRTVGCRNHLRRKKPSAEPLTSCGVCPWRTWEIDPEPPMSSNASCLLLWWALWVCSSQFCRLWQDKMSTFPLPLASLECKVWVPWHEVVWIAWTPAQLPP